MPTAQCPAGNTSDTLAQVFASIGIDLTDSRLVPDGHAVGGPLTPFAASFRLCQPAFAITLRISPALNARNVVVRIFPWPATVSRAAVAVSSSGASTTPTRS